MNTMLYIVKTQDCAQPYSRFQSVINSKLGQ